MSNQSSTDHKPGGVTGRRVPEPMIWAAPGIIWGHLDRSGNNAEGAGLHRFVQGKIVVQ